MENANIEKSIKKLSIGFMAVSAGFAGLSLGGWVSHQEDLTNPFLGVNVMKFNTALCLLLLSMAFSVRIFDKDKKTGALTLALVSSSLVIILTTLTLVEHIFQIDLRIDQLFWTDWQSVSGVPGRMSVATAIGLFSLALTQVCWKRAIGFYPSCLAALISVMALIGYATDCPVLYGAWHQIRPEWVIFNTMAFNTACSIFSLMLVSLLSMPHSNLRKCLIASDAGGYVARMVFPCVIFVPLFCAVVAARLADLGFYPSSVAPSCTIVLVVLFLSGGILKLCNRLSSLDNAALVNYRARTDVLYSLAHDLRVPIIGTDRILSLLLSNNTGLNSYCQKDLLSKLKNVQQDMLCMIENFVFEQKIEEGFDYFEPKLADAAEFMKPTREKFEDWAAAEKINLQFNVDSHIKLIWCDQALMKRLIANLVHNSLKHTCAGGKIAVNLLLDESDLIIEVEDTGHGIAEHEVEQVFLRHWQSDKSRFKYQPSNGLGLFICKRIVEQHGGEISCASIIGEGTKFTIRLPKAHILPLVKSEHHAVEKHA